MSHTAQPPYGRQVQQQYGYGPGGYPPQGNPAQQAPGRYYTPGPPGEPTKRLSIRSSTDNESDSVNPQPNNPPQNGPLPFFLAGQAAQQPPQQQPHYPPNDLRSRTPSGNQFPPSSDPYHHRPQSTFENPQELSTSQYATPTEPGRPQSYPPPHQASAHPLQPQPDDYSPSVYSSVEADLVHHHHSQTTQQQQQQHSYNQVPPATQPQQHAPPNQPPLQAPSPNPAQSPYPVLNTGPPAGIGYHAYHAPPQQQQQQQQPQGYAAEPGGNPNDFYR